MTEKKIKKICSLILGMVIAVSLTACGADQGTAAKSTSASAVENQTVAPTETPAETPIVTQEPAETPAPTETPVPTEEPKDGPEEIQVIDGGVTLVEGGTPIESKELTSFSLYYEVSGMYEEGSEREGIILQGVYDLSMEKQDTGVLCEMHYDQWASDPDDGVIRDVVLTLENDALERLEAVLQESRIKENNGFYAYDSALGNRVDLNGEYASGETLSIYAEGGVSTEVPADLDAVTMLFNELADENGERFTHMMGRDDVFAQFMTFIAREIPQAAETPQDELTVEFEKNIDTGDIEINYGTEKDGWNAYARCDLWTGEYSNIIYMYSGINHDDPQIQQIYEYALENIPGAADTPEEELYCGVQISDGIKVVQIDCLDEDFNMGWVIEVYDYDPGTGLADGYYGYLDEAGQPQAFEIQLEIDMSV